MKTSLLSQSLLAAIFAVSLGACGIGSAPKAEPEESPPVQVKPPVPVTPDDDDGDEGETPVVDEGRRQEALARSATRRKEILLSMNAEPTWRTKFAIAAKWAQALDYQTWKPVKSFKDDRADREDLFDLALREFFISWETYSRDVEDRQQREVDVHSSNAGVQGMLALALAMDQRNAQQDKYANRYGFEKFSVFGLIRDTLINKRQVDAALAFENTIGVNEVIALGALEWRMNGLFVWAWELAMNDVMNGGIFENSDLDIGRVPTASMNFVLDLLSRANTAAIQLTVMKKNLKDANKRAIVLNPKMRATYKRMRFDRADKALAKEPNAERKRAGMKMVAELKKVQAWLQ